MYRTVPMDYLVYLRAYFRNKGKEEEEQIIAIGKGCNYKLLYHNTYNA